jgi:hypothetical protein
MNDPWNVQGLQQELQISKIASPAGSAGLEEKVAGLLISKITYICYPGSSN